MPYRITPNNEGFKVYNLDKGTSFQFHSHDRDKLDSYLRQREAYSHGFVRTYGKRSKRGKAHIVRGHYRK